MEIDRLLNRDASFYSASRFKTPRGGIKACAAEWNGSRKLLYVSLGSETACAAEWNGSKRTRPEGSTRG